MHLASFFTYLQYYHGRILSATIEHILIVCYSLPPAVLLGVSAGVFAASRPRLARILIGLAGVIMTIPSLALFGLMVVVLAPFGLGLGALPAVCAIILYSFLPIIRNTTAALAGVDPGALEAARGMGLSPAQILFRIKLPLALPVIMAGVRSAMVLGVGVAAFAFLVAAGGLGYFVIAGIGRSNIYMVVTGTILISMLGIAINVFLLKTEDWLTPRGLQLAAKQRRSGQL